MYFTWSVVSVLLWLVLICSAFKPRGSGKSFARLVPIVSYVVCCRFTIILALSLSSSHWKGIKGSGFHLLSKLTSTGTGTCKYFDDSKGCGLITSSTGECFVVNPLSFDYRDSYRTSLSEGDNVSFTVKVQLLI